MVINERESAMLAYPKSKHNPVREMIFIIRAFSGFSSSDSAGDALVDTVTDQCTRAGMTAPEITDNLYNLIKSQQVQLVFRLKSGCPVAYLRLIGEGIKIANEIEEAYHIYTSVMGLD
jgi:hypothetical protein